MLLDGPACNDCGAMMVVEDTWGGWICLNCEERKRTKKCQCGWEPRDLYHMLYCPEHPSTRGEPY